MPLPTRRMISERCGKTRGRQSAVEAPPNKGGRSFKGSAVLKEPLGQPDRVGFAVSVATLERRLDPTIRISSRARQSRRDRFFQLGRGRWADSMYEN